jgi:signal transduction histidine kinase
MEVQKESLIGSISRAKAELDSVLESLEQMHTFDPSGTRVVAHGLNNLLTVMLGTLELLSIDIAGSANQLVLERLQIALQTLEKAKLLVRELFNSTALSNLEYDFRLVNISSMVLYAVDYYSRAAKQKRIELLKDENDREIEVWADRIGVAVVLDNLLSNAIKYTNPGGRVHVQVRREQNSCLCSICDNGPGLAEEDLAQLFQPGVRLSAIPTGGESSSGYGLAVAKKVIDNMHGEIWCDTEYGKGACFRFRLPIRP